MAYIVIYMKGDEPSTNSLGTLYAGFNGSRMVSMASCYAPPFSAVFNGSRPNPSLKPAAFLVPSLKCSAVISNSGNLSNGFSLKSPINPGFLFKSRYFTVHSRAAAEKTVHDFTVKVWFLSSYPIIKKKRN